MLLDFLTDAISHMHDFRDDIVMVYVFEETPGAIVATGNHPKRLLFYKSEATADLTGEIEAPAYLGALGYLRSMLTSSMMRESPEIELTYQEGPGGKRLSVSAMQFRSKTFESQFQCTNPNILNDKDRVHTFPRPADAIFFPINKEMRKKFDDVARFGTPKADVRLFTLTYDGNYVRAQFGGGTHSSTLILTDQVTGHTEQKITKLVSLDRFQTMLKLAADNIDPKGAFHPNAVWVDFNTAQALHTVVSPTIRDQNK